MTKLLKLLFASLALAVLVRAESNDKLKSPGSTAAGTNVAAPKPPPDLGALLRMHWETRVRAFKEQNLSWQNVVLLGDSITEGFEVTKYFPGWRVLNRGIGADVIGNDMPAGDPRGVLQRLDNSVFDCAATDVFILIGINDLNTGRKVEAMEAGYRELLKRVRGKRPDLRIHIQSVLLTRGTHEKQNGPVREFNERLKKLTAEFGCSFIDLHLLMRDESGQLKAEFTNDGLHLTEPAYVVWREQIFKAMNWK
jgi:lysophospholipase L1-like esterase